VLESQDYFLIFVEIQCVEYYAYASLKAMGAFRWWGYGGGWRTRNWMGYTYFFSQSMRKSRSFASWSSICPTSNQAI